MFECVWQFCGIGAERVNITTLPDGHVFTKVQLISCTILSSVVKCRSDFVNNMSIGIMLFKILHFCCNNPITLSRWICTFSNRSSVFYSCCKKLILALCKLRYFTVRSVGSYGVSYIKLAMCHDSITMK